MGGCSGKAESRADRQQKFEPGDVIKMKSIWSCISPVAIWHYGIVTGPDSVVHFDLSNEFDIRIQETTLKDFLGRGSSLQKCLISELHEEFSPDEIVVRARAQIGTDFGGYSLLRNNCEHFANWCASGDKFSNQIPINEGEDHSIGDKFVEKRIYEPLIRQVQDPEEAEELIDRLQENKDRLIETLDEIFDII